MSIQFGSCNFDAKAVDRGLLDQARTILARYCADAENLYCTENVGILYRALHTTKESRDEAQPLISDSGFLFTWDGRLDNREELIRELGDTFPLSSPDSVIAAAAYEKWSTKSFQKLLGDWTLSIWNPEDQFLILAKDFSGTRQLFYRTEKQNVTWCTVLEPLVLSSRHSIKLDEEYIAGWLSQFPICDLTPYAGIRSVPPASFVRIDGEGEKITKFWDFNPGYRILYRTDGEYEEHFRVLFLESVRRRLRADSVVVAELSGGMDSSSIVCAAGAVIKEGCADLCEFETLSYFDDSEPNWDERPYFSVVEEKLGRKSHHIDVSFENPLQFDTAVERLLATPASAEFSKEVHDQFQAVMLSSGSRVLLTGTGGDEITGGVPTPLPELQDLLARGRLKRLARQLKLWALNKRRPWIHVLVEATAGFLPNSFVSLPKHLRPAPWVDKQFVTKHRAAFAGYDRRLKISGPLPSFAQNVAAFNLLQRQLGCEELSASPAYEKRYPYLDRNLVEFMYAIPREQVIRPGQRRSLMRRALTRIVPLEILGRKRKAYVAHAGTAGISSEWPHLRQMFQRSLSGALGFINDAAFVEALDLARHGKDVSIVAVARTLLLETWLRNLEEHGILAGLDNWACILESSRIPKISAEEIQPERR